MRFGISGDLAYFNVSDDGLTATRTIRRWGFMCAVPSFNDGTERSHILCRDKTNGSRFFPTGAHKATFRIDKMSRNMLIALGVVPAAKAKALVTASTDVGYLYWSDGYSYARAQRGAKFGESYRPGDVITVRLDLNANIVSFGKNGVDVGSLRAIAPGDAYHFAVNFYEDGDTVTIIEEIE